MAYTANELVSSVTTIPATLRVWPTTITPKTVSNVGAAPLYATLTPMAFNTSTLEWVVWADSGANGTAVVGGFLLEPCQTDATNDVIANMIMGGKIHFDDIPVPSGGTNSSTTLKAALRNGMRAKGFDIVGLDGVY